MNARATENRIGNKINSENANPDRPQNINQISSTPLDPEMPDEDLGATGGPQGAINSGTGSNDIPLDEDWLPGAKRKLRSPNSQISTLEPSQKRTPTQAAERTDRKYAVEITNVALSSAKTRKEFAQTLARIIPEKATVRESLTTADGRILVFTSEPHDFNLLCLADRWKTSEGPVTAKPASKGGVSRAVVIHGVDGYISPDMIIEGLKSIKIAATSANRFKRSFDGAETANIKVFINSEEHAQKIIQDGFFHDFKHHAVTRYTAPKWRQCFICQGLGHISPNCNTKTRRCLKCSLGHHHRECLATPDKYVCSNCGGNHCSNNSICPRIKEILDPAADARNSSQPQTRTTVENLGPAWGQEDFPRMSTVSKAAEGPPQLDAIEIETLVRSTVRSAVADAMSEAMTAQMSIIGNIIGREIGKGFKAMSDDLKSIVARYEEDLDVLEEAVISMGKKLNQTIIPTASTPISDPKEDRYSKLAGAIPRQTRPVIFPSTEALQIRLPPLDIQIAKGGRHNDLEKRVKSQLKAGVKALEKDLFEIFPEVKSSYISMSPIDPPPVRRRQTSMPPTSVTDLASAMSSSETESPATSDGDSSSKIATRKIRQKKTTVKKTLLKFKPPNPATNREPPTLPQTQPHPPLPDDKI